MKDKFYASDYLNNGVKGHSHYKFVDIEIDKDTKLFIDPLLIEIASDPWCEQANRSIQSFFDQLFEAYRNGSSVDERELLSHAKEQNGTRLGYGRGDNGKGNTAEGLLKIFSPLEKMLLSIRTIQKASDLKILLPGFAEDGLSDLITNILHDQLNLFTTKQLKLYGMKNNAKIQFWTWNYRKLMWEFVSRPAYFIDNKEVLLVPKNVVRKRYLFSVEQYLERIIAERTVESHKNPDGSRPPKREITKRIRKSGPHGLYEESISYTEKDNNILTEYHIKLPGFYKERGGAMTDEELDDYIYGI